jgi:molybdopterin-binding protein
MNFIEAIVSDIQSNDSITIVTFDFDNTHLRMMSLDLNTPIVIGSKVKLGIKASSIALAKDLSGVMSISNQLQSVVKSVNNGELLSSVKLDIKGFILESIITLASSKKLTLKENDNVVALIKSSELSIIEVIE